MDLLQELYDQYQAAFCYIDEDIMLHESESKHDIAQSLQAEANFYDIASFVLKMIAEGKNLSPKEAWEAFQKGSL